MRLTHRWLHAAAVILLLIAAAAAAIAYRGSLDHDDSIRPSSNSQSQSHVATKQHACGIFTLAEAKQVLGDSAKGGDNQLDTSSEDIETSTCNYTQDLSSSNVPVSGVKTASLTVKTPKTADGAKSNRQQFAGLKPSDSQDVSGYGDNAYWDQTNGQLNILKNDIWYGLRLGSSDSHSLEQTRQLADILINKI